MTIPIDVSPIHATIINEPWINIMGATVVETPTFCGLVSSTGFREIACLLCLETESAVTSGPPARSK